MLERQVAGAARAGCKTRLLVSLRQGRVGVESARASVLSGWRGMREIWRLLCRSARKVRRAVSLLQAEGLPQLRQQLSIRPAPPALPQPLRCRKASSTPSLASSTVPHLVASLPSSERASSSEPSAEAPRPTSSEVQAAAGGSALASSSAAARSSQGGCMLSRLRSSCACMWKGGAGVGGVTPKSGGCRAAELWPVAAAAAGRLCGAYWAAMGVRVVSLHVSHLLSASEAWIQALTGAGSCAPGCVGGSRRTCKLNRVNSRCC